MNELLKYEEEIRNLLTDLPLPDENAAWLDMKRRLDDDDDLVPAVPLRWGCGIAVLLLFALGVFSWWFVQHKNLLRKKELTTDSVNLRIRSVVNDTARKANYHIHYRDTLSKKINDSVTSSKDSINSTIVRIENRVQHPDIVIGKKNVLKNKEEEIRQNRTKKASSGKQSEHTLKAIQRVQIDRENYTPGKQKRSRTENQNVTIVQTGKERQNNLNDHRSYDTTINRSEVVDIIKQKLTLKDSSLKTNIDTVTQKSIKNNNAKSFSIAAGISLQQQIPFDGQSVVPYNYYGRKGTLADYIPSVYLKLYRDKKWFIQAEFRYGAPEYAKSFAYRTNSVSDSMGNSIVNSLLLKKTYYHQLPVSFNYYIRSKLTVGIGFVWSKFYGAVSEEEIRLRNDFLQIDSLISKKIIQTKANTDSFFTKSQLSWLLESQYSWGHFTFGMRYSLGLQPYIRYTNAAGVLSQRKNQSIQVLVRYELWKSGLFKKKRASYK